jgi:hypothetical protein
MPSHAEIASKLLADAAGFFATLGEQNPELADQMTDNADVFRQMSALIVQQPDGVLDGKSHAELAGQLLKDGAAFFLALAEQNEPLKEQMTQNAEVYIQLGDMVATDPHGVME